MRRHLNSFRSIHLLKYVRELLSPKAFKATNPPEKKTYKNIKKNRIREERTRKRQMRRLTDWWVSSRFRIRFRFPIRIQYQSELSESAKNIQFP